MAWLFIGLMTILAGHEGPATIAGAEHYRDDRPSISQVGTHVMHHEHHDFTTADATGEFVVSSNMTPRTAAETEADNYDGIYKPRPDHRDIATEGQNYSKPVMRAQNRGHRQAPNVENGGEMAINSPGQEYTVDPVLNDATSLSQYSLAIGAKWSKALMITLPAMAFEEMMPGEEPPWYWNLIDQGQELVRQGANGYDLGWQIVHSLLNHNDQALLTDMDLHYNGILRALQQEQRRHHHQRGTLLCAEEAQQRYVNKVVSTVVCHWMQGDVYARTRKRCRSNSPPANSPGVPDEQESDIQDLMERWKGDKRHASPTRLWKELPETHKTHTRRKLPPPWKKQNNPPLQPHPPRHPPGHPSSDTPRTRSKPGRCSPSPIKEPETPQDEPGAVDGDEMTLDDAMAVWKAFFEFGELEIGGRWPC